MACAGGSCSEVRSSAHQVGGDSFSCTPWFADSPKGSPWERRNRHAVSTELNHQWALNFSFMGPMRADECQRSSDVQWQWCRRTLMA